MKTAVRILCLMLCVLTVFGMTPAFALAVSPKTDARAAGEGASFSEGYTVYALEGTVTALFGSYLNGVASEGAILEIALSENAFAGHTFDCWKSSEGVKVPTATFQVMIDRDVWFYPTFTDLEGSFGDWTLIKDGGCEEGKVYRRDDPATGLAEFKKVFPNSGGHEFSSYRTIDAQTCAAVCRICGYEMVEQHNWSEYETVREATHSTTGLMRATCCMCGYTAEVIVPKTDEHIWSGEWEIIEEAKNGQPGVRRRHCLYCDAYEDYWYIRAEWEKYYFGNKIWYDSTDSIGTWGTDDELHYNFINDEGYETFVYAVRQDYRDNYQSYVFMWIDHADNLGRKPLYLAKSKGHDDSGYYAYRGFDWAIVGYLDSKEAFISEIDHISCGYDRYSSGFFDLAVKYEEFFNEAMIPTDEEPDLVSYTGAWVYDTDGGAYALRTDSYTGVDYIPFKYNDSRYYMHVDPETNVCISFWEPNASSRRAYIRAVQALVTPAEYAAISGAFTPDIMDWPTIEYPATTVPAAGHEHVFDIWSSDWLPYDDEQHINFCSECGEPIYRGHSYSTEIDFDVDLPRNSTKRRTCSCGYFTDHELNVMSTDGIAAEIRYVFQMISSITSVTVDVLHTPTPKNFQMRVNAYWYLDGPRAEPGYDNTPYDNRYRWYGSNRIWEYGYEVTDWFSFGIVRTESSPKGYSNYSGGDTFFVELIYEEVDGYAFERWEIYDWATGEWVFFSGEEEPRFNTVSWDGDAQTATSFTLDTRLTDMTLLRCVRSYTGNEAGPATVTVEGGECYVSGAYEERQPYGEFPAGTMVYFEYDEAAVPAGKCFAGWQVSYNGEITDDCSYAYGFTLSSGDYTFTAVYENELYYVQVYADNGRVYLIGDGTEEEYWGESYEAGAILQFRTEGYAPGEIEEGDDGYPYFYGWYFVGQGKEEGSAEEELISRDLTLSYTVTGEMNGYITAKWGDTATPRIDYHDLTAVNGFATVSSYRNGLFVSSIRVRDYSYVLLTEDPRLNMDTDEWALASTDDETFEMTLEAYGAYGNADFWIDESYPVLLTATARGSAHAHAFEHIEALTPDCTEYGNVEYWYCEGCDKYFLDENGEEQTDYESVLLDPLGHDFGDWAWSESTHTRTCRRCGETEEGAHTGSAYHSVDALRHAITCPVCGCDFALERHSFDAGVITVFPTTTSEGTIVYTCTDCGYTVEGVLEKLTDHHPDDINGDGEVTVGDVSALLDLIAGATAGTAPVDLDGDGDMTVADVTALLDFIAGNG